MSNTCFNCGQVMPEFIDPFNTAQIRSAIAATYNSWEDMIEGASVNISNLPADAFSKVVAVESNTDYDSYGEGNGSGYVVFQVTQGLKTVNYKIDGTMGSYSGWDWEEAYISQVNPQPVTKLIWESV